MPTREHIALIDPDVLNLPDILFSAWCQQQYGVNRGVYNTIDHWFFQKGCKQIVSRRRKIISFLQQVPQLRVKKGDASKIKLGKGMLIPSLNAFVENEAIAHSV